jgi:hypothetical protein
MALMPGAAHLLMPYSASLPLRTGPTTVIVHTNGGGANLYGWFARPGNTICSHFQVFRDGRIEQYLDTARVAYAQWDANPFGISVETEDDGDPDTPWTAAQIRSIQAIIRWTSVPHRLAPESGGGIGYHQQYTAWNQSGHGCPGSVRVNQLKNTVIPGLAAPASPPKDWFDSVDENTFRSKYWQPLVNEVNELQGKVAALDSNAARSAQSRNLISTLGTLFGQDMAGRKVDDDLGGAVEAIGMFVRRHVPSPDDIVSHLGTLMDTGKAGRITKWARSVVGDVLVQEAGERRFVAPEQPQGQHEASEAQPSTSTADSVADPEPGQ